MNDCLFCKLSRGEIPANRVYEDDHTLAFLDINPASPGHTLVIPREHAANLFELSPAALAAVAHTTQVVARRLNQVLGPDGLNVLQNNGAAAGQVVFHYHVHLIPRRVDDGVLRPNRQSQATPAELADLAARVRVAE